MLYNIITVYFMERQDMEIRFNPMKITGVGAFGDVRGRTAAGIRSVYFILCTGYYDGLSEDIRELDRKLSADEHCIYRRVTDLPVMGVKEAAEYGEKWERLCRGESVISPETEKALKEVCSIYRNLRKNINPTIEKNFAAVLMFYSDRLSGKMTCDSGKCPKLVCSGRIGLKEYLFSHMAALMGIDVMLLCPSGLPQLPEELERTYEHIRLGECGSYAVPPYITQTVQPVSAANAPVPASTGARTAAAAGRHISQPAPKAPVNTPPASNVHTSQAGSGELSYEELASLASSVVMITLHNSRGKVIGTGSGMIIGKDGYILTNFHVAGGARSFSVQLENDDTVYRTSELIKYHPSLDLAILRIDRQQLYPMKLYSGKRELCRGQRVVAIGSPLGLFNTVSDGIISGFREINGVDMIQFTAPISGGSSGGALLNMYGEVIGISTAGFSKGQNLNLAVGYKDIIPFISNFIDK